MHRRAHACVFALLVVTAACGGPERTERDAAPVVDAAPARDVIVDAAPLDEGIDVPAPPADIVVPPDEPVVPDVVVDTAVTDAVVADTPVLPALATVTFAEDVSYRAGDGTNWVGLGDFNGDRHLDVVAVNTDTSSVSLLLGNGDGTLRPANTVPLMHSARNGALVYAAIGDLEGDGRADLAVSWRNVPEITVFRGASFGTPAHLNAQGPEGIAIAELNGDGRADLVYASRTNTGHYLNVALQARDGSFAAPLQTRVSIPSVVLPRDHDGDGDLDLTVLASPLLTFRNAGDGTFTESWRGTGIFGGDGFAIADFTGDGLLDIVAAYSGTNLKSLRRGTAGDTFAESTTELSAGDDRHLATGDFNRDGRADLVVSACCNTLGVGLGRGDGTFMTQSVRIGCGTIGGFVAGDLDEDGRQDLIVAHGGCDSVSVLLNRSR